MALQVQSSAREAKECEKRLYTRVKESSTIIIIANHSMMPQLNTDEAGRSGNDASLDAFPKWVRCCLHSGQCRGTVWRGWVSVCCCKIESPSFQSFRGTCWNAQKLTGVFRNETGMSNDKHSIFVLCKGLFNFSHTICLERMDCCRISVFK